MRLGIKRRLLAVTFLAVLALAQVLPASAGYANLDSAYCDGYGTSSVYASSANGQVEYNSGNCTAYAGLSVWDDITQSYVAVGYDIVQNDDAYIGVSGYWLAIKVDHFLRQIGTGYGISATTYAYQ